MDAGCPTRIAIACSNCDARDSDVRVLRFGCLELGLRLSDSLIRIDSGLVQNPGQPERFLIGRDGGVQQLLQGILSAELEIVGSHLRVHGQPDIFEVGSACLRVVDVAANVVANAAPQVRHPGRIEGKRVFRECG